MNKYQAKVRYDAVYDANEEEHSSNLVSMLHVQKQALSKKKTHPISNPYCPSVKPTVREANSN